jgi:hypothetical protein
VRCSAKQHVLGPYLDNPAGIHHGDAVDERCDNGKVMAHVERGNAMHPAKHPNGLEDVRLGRHIQSCRRLVQNDHARPAREGHRQANTLLLAT